MKLKSLSFVVIICWTLAAWNLHAADKNLPTFTNPADAGIDYQLQGEYLGDVQTDEGKKPTGAHIIALGDGKFRGVGYHGGLPGAGWSRDAEKNETEGAIVDGVLRFKTDNIEAEVRDGKITIHVDGREVGVLSKVERRSPTLGAAPPAGALVLFDGSHTNAWENGKLVEGNLLAASNVYSKEKLGDHHLHVEFRTPFMPTARGQARGNSGVYVQGRFEVQVLDSFGLEGENNECGGIYSLGRPAVNMCFPPLAWQTYDIDFTAARYDAQGNKAANARITVRHNGELIHDNIEATRGTPGGRSGEGPEPEALFLQDHGNPVVYRNIWVVKK